MLRCIASLWIQPYDVEDVLELIAFPQLKRLRNTVHQKHRCPAVCLRTWLMTITQTVSLRADVYDKLY
jgi:hypothetical protein